MSSDAPAPKRPPERYGEQPRPVRRLAAVGLLAVLGLAVLGLVSWAGWRVLTPEVRTGLLTFDVVDDRRVDVRFEVVAAPEATLECDLRAQNFARETVGSERVTVMPAPGARREVLATVRTRERAVHGEVQDCWVVPPG